MAYTVVIDPMALEDIQEAIDYYDEQQIGLGEKFEAALNKHLVSLEKNPLFQIRYDQVHCLPADRTKRISGPNSINKLKGMNIE